VPGRELNITGAPLDTFRCTLAADGGYIRWDHPHRGAPPPRPLGELVINEKGLAKGSGDSEVCKLLNGCAHNSSYELNESSLEGPGIGIGEARIPPSALTTLGLR